MRATLSTVAMFLTMICFSIEDHVATASHCHAAIMRIQGCYSLKLPAEQNASDIIGVEWQLFIKHYLPFLLVVIMHNLFLGYNVITDL